ncbi:ATP-binding protein [Streptomyces chartreusis]|uniref:ATP-binding protein n=1 Tax=Streptomyces chartreusis TaxID=1969 RepID=UPI0038283040
MNRCGDLLRSSLAQWREMAISDKASIASWRGAPKLRWTMEFECQLASVPRARSQIRKVLELWGYPEGVMEDAGIVTTELAANACMHARSDGCEQFGIGLATADDWLTILVSDSSTGMPSRKTSGRYDEGGRGLILVEALGACWGTERHPGAGKVVWVRLDAPSPSWIDTPCAIRRHADTTPQ